MRWLCPDLDSLAGLSGPIRTVAMPSDEVEEVHDELALRKVRRRAYHRAYYHAVYKPKRKAYYQRTKDRDRAKKTAAANRRYWNAPEVARQKARDRLRLKYATDPDYRARVLAKSAKRRAMLKESA